MRDTNAAADDVTDDEIRDAIKLLAETEGIFAETAGGVTVGVAKKLIACRQDSEGFFRRHLRHRQRLEDARRRARSLRQGARNQAEPARVRGAAGAGRKSECVI